MPPRLQNRADVSVPRCHEEGGERQDCERCLIDPNIEKDGAQEEH